MLPHLTTPWIKFLSKRLERASSTNHATFWREIYAAEYDLTFSPIALRILTWHLKAHAILVVERHEIGQLKVKCDKRTRTTKQVSKHWHSFRLWISIFPNSQIQDLRFGCFESQEYQTLTLIRAFPPAFLRVHGVLQTLGLHLLHGRLPRRRVVAALEVESVMCDDCNRQNFDLPSSWNPDSLLKSLTWRWTFRSPRHQGSCTPPSDDRPFLKKLALEVSL